MELIESERQDLCMSFLNLEGMKSAEIRQRFLDFFEKKSHTIVPSAPMVIKGDPTLMFTNAGMNQFKDIILGNVRPKATRVADSQKCLRVSGKHNDLEEVGHDTYHHTMFEMLGNWSFGDYFKKEAIAYAWEFLTGEMGLDKNRLYATVFEGSKDDHLEEDKEALEYWKLYLPEDRILYGNKKDNFWEMGDMGPCGPCSEIHIDLRPEAERVLKPGRELVNKDNPLVIEIWNLVFMQYNRKADGSLENLPSHHVDTGMGFERLCMAVQGKTSNYDTDVFTPIIGEIARLSGKEYGKDAAADVAMRVIADHLRTIAFSITDGQLPSNVKAGYVIRRILRRAVRYAYTFLDQKDAFMYKLVPVLIEVMGQHYPELSSQRVLIERVIQEEENAFLRTLDKGIKLLDKIIEKTKAEEYILNYFKMMKEIDSMFKSNRGVLENVRELLNENEGLKKDVEKFTQESLRIMKEGWKNEKRVIRDINMIVKTVMMPPANVKDIAFQLKGELNNLILVIGGVFNNKPHLTVMFSDSLVKDFGLHAGQLVKDAAQEIKGGGGGQPFFATAGGSNPEGISKALERAEKLILDKIH